MPPKPFVRGDPRINRKGRPKNQTPTEIIEAIAHKIGLETVKQDDGHKRSLYETVLRKCATSNNPAMLALFLAYAGGKPRERVSIDSNATLTVKLRWPDADYVAARNRN